MEVFSYRLETKFVMLRPLCSLSAQTSEIRLKITLSSFYFHSLYVTPIFHSIYSIPHISLLLFFIHIYFYNKNLMLTSIKAIWGFCLSLWKIFKKITHQNVNRNTQIGVELDTFKQKEKN